ncbi:carbohydrate esterase family 4 protein [Tulasnella calospora MUT 4182]|uniref:chitin deacetylase n=1 Tax=Tulasnella calospora MUT 4182 TaxID=1051891 RepID=A0A0C3QXX2_9AGAM|nr:carbohydrate esterase family 4 protein [Tulasnella calospora MUT 4182]
MRFSSRLAAVVALSASGLATAKMEVRQASSSNSAAAATASIGSTQVVPASATPSLSFASTNPTAVPLGSITMSAPVQATAVLRSNLVATPGATPPISGAPPLPSWAFTPGSFPALDQIPPIDSPQVQAWIQEVASSGVTVPTLSATTATQDNPCTANAALAADTSRCWWTCGGCTRQTDIVSCPDKLTWGVSFDDGPSDYTADLLNYMDDVKLKSTFFVVGSRAISRPNILQAEYMAGHQLSVHTWSHPSLTTLTNEQIIAELGWTREAIRQITGVSPNTMRPPYGDIDDRVRAIAQAMGMTPIIWTGDFDTDDWHVPSGFSPYAVIQSFDQILATASTLNTGFIVLAHDLYQQTVDLAAGYILPDALARTNPKFSLMSIIECQHKPLSDAYVETNNNQTNPFASNAIPATGTGAVSATAAGTGSASGSTGTAAAASTTSATKNAAVAKNVGWTGAVAAVAVAVGAVALM